MKGIESSHHQFDFCDCCGMPTHGAVYVTANEISIYCPSCVAAMQSAIEAEPTPTPAIMMAYLEWLRKWEGWRYHPAEVQGRIDAEIKRIETELEAIWAS